MYNGENWIHRNYTSFCSNRLWWNDEFRTEIRSARFQSNTKLLRVAICAHCNLIR